MHGIQRYVAPSPTSSNLEQEQGDETSRKSVQTLYWEKTEHRVFKPKDNAIKFIGLAYRGDSREPSEIFKTGFILKGNRKISSDVEFTDRLFSTRLEAYPKKQDIDCDSRNVFLDRQFAPNPETAICLSKLPEVASYFPDCSDEGNTYLYCCFINQGIPIHETLDEINEMFCETFMAKAAKEIVTPEIPPEHIISAWRVERLKTEKPCRQKSFRIRASTAILNQAKDDCVKKYMESNKIPDPVIPPTTNISVSYRSVVHIDA